MALQLYYSLSQSPLGHGKIEQQAESLAAVSLLICSQLNVRRSTWKLQDAVMFKSRPQLVMDGVSLWDRAMAHSLAWDS